MVLRSESLRSAHQEWSSTAKPQAHSRQRRFRATFCHGPPGQSPPLFSDFLMMYIFFHKNSFSPQPILYPLILNEVDRIRENCPGNLNCRFRRFTSLTGGGDGVGASSAPGRHWRVRGSQEGCAFALTRRMVQRGGGAKGRANGPVGTVRAESSKRNKRGWDPGNHELIFSTTKIHFLPRTDFLLLFLNEGDRI